MATTKEILDEFCDRCNIPRESSYVGNSSPAARQYVSLLKFIGQELRSNPNGWPQLKKIYSFTISTGVSNYQLPGDFDRMLTGTQWNATQQQPLAGPISNAQMAFQTYGVVTASPYSAYQLNGAQGYIFNTSPYTQRSAGYFEITPPGQNSTDVNAIAYISSNWCWAQNWVANTAYVQGNIRTGVNNMYICTTAGTSGTTRPSVTTGTVVDGTVTWTVYNEPYAMTADTDFILFDDDIMVEGLRWAYYRSKKQDYAQERKDWELSVKSALSRQNGAVIVNAGYNRNNAWEWPLAADGNWPGTGGT
jgi:hypothetical protein